jgi:hypothetical protein
MKSALLKRIREELGSSGTAAVVLLVGCVLFLFMVLQPLQQRSARLDEHLVGSQSASPSSQSAEDRLSAFYRFFDRPEQATDWLARLSQIGQSVGLELRSAEYKTFATQTRIERYEISLPVTGTYQQVRLFLQKALHDIPVLSLDQVSFKRSASDQNLVDAQLRLTLHMVKP